MENRSKMDVIRQNERMCDYNLDHPHPTIDLSVG